MNRAESTALLIGATGLVGTQLLQQLLEDDDYGRVVTFGRRELGRVHPRLTHHEVDFDDPDSWSSLLTGDVLFSAMGTTVKSAGSKEAQRHVDYDYQLETARRAQMNGARRLVLVSSTGADSKSAMFYLRMKGELEEAVLGLGFAHVALLRPSLLDGDRKEHRSGEKWGLRVARLLPEWDAFSKIRPVQASTVARAARLAARARESRVIWEAEDILNCAD